MTDSSNGDRDRTPFRVFLSYASADDSHRFELEKHLAPLKRQGFIDTWSDRKILPGGAWGSEISDELEAADIILCLVSADFLASDYCWDIEMKRALEREKSKEAVVIPIVVGPL